jgi:excisionase family DNA binding protein
METLSFNDIPAAIAELTKKVDQLLAMANQTPVENPDRLMSIEQLRDHLPEHPARQTIYQWVNERRIPFVKYGRKLYFRASDVDAWQNNGRQMVGL